MTVMQCVREWLKLYPNLKGRLDVDFLDEDTDTYSLDTIPCEEVIKRYKDGSTMKQFQFAVSSRRYYEQNIAQNLENLEFFEGLTAWVEDKAHARELPFMDENRTAQKIIVTSTAYPFEVTENGKARYQLQMRLEYFNKRSV
jgi:hypothetical protein